VRQQIDAVILLTEKAGQHYQNYQAEHDEAQNFQ
jgi:hypothetical protein